MATLSAAPDPHGAARRLKRVLDPDARLWPASGLLLGDTLAGIGFAAGLAGSVVHLSAGGAALVPWLALLFAAGIARGVCGLSAARIGAAAARRTKCAVRASLIDHVLRRAPAGQATTGALLAAAVDEIEALDGYVARFLPARAAASLAPLLVIGATALASPIAAGILIGTLIPFVAAMILAGGAAAEQSRRQFAALSRLSGLFADRIRALPILLAFDGAAREAERLGVASDELARRTMRVLRIAFVSSGALEFFAALSVALVAVYAGFNLLGLLPFPVPEKLDLARGFFVLALAPEFYLPMRRIAAAYHDKQAAQTAVDRLPEAVFAPPQGHAPARRFERPPGIRFDDVTIRYSTDDAPPVRHFSFDLAPGAIVALVGPSGSGKSSLLHLLLGLAPLSGGRVLVDGLEPSDQGSVAASAAWIGQTPLVVAGTLRANLALAWPAATDRDIASAAERAGLGPMLATRGLDAPINARGGGLSGGEIRRIALARAILKPSSILLLDEPTAHLDPHAEAALIATIRRLANGRTTLIATHSAALAAIADRRVSLAAPE
ncbi:thiol reductant ABC exporter subunit CydD [Sphingomonas sp. PAMC 26605]|uniref:thiol reductant ABC exporter subunit CydD n=1 Tax=Sphingomonas sp. PAMC 26605 TaxID=1112214 RepID=UPI00026CAC7D|nr:thiol reductant ABC exporter subunit CydD [Sphingomonas sp. PAMC 26605]